VAYSSVILGTPGIVSYWRLGEASGNALDSKDSSPGTIAGGITRAVTGLLVNDTDKAMQSDGVLGSFVNVPYAANMNVGAQLTLEFWCKPVSLPATTSYPVGRYQSAGQLWYVRNYGGTDGRWEFDVYDTNSVRISFASPGTADKAAVGKRQHIVMTYDAAGQLNGYVDGVAVGTGAPAPNANVKDDVSISFRIFQASGTAGANFPGVIDEVALYNTALTAQQVLDHYNAGLGAAINSDLPVGTIALSGSRTESYAPTRSDAPTGRLTLSGSRTESFIGPTVYTDARSGTLALSGSRTESSSGPTRYTDAPTGTVALSGSLTDWETIATAVGWGTQVLELPPLRLHVEAVRLDGKRYRWGSDEPDPQNVPTGLRFSSTMPGGFESMDCVLPRKPGPVGETADLDRLSTLIVRGAGGAIAGEYRLERTPKTSGDQMAVAPSAVGWQAHLDDNKGASIIYFDRELAGWGSPSRQRILNLIAGSFNPLGGGSVVPDTTTGVPALDIGIDDPGGWLAANKPIVEPLYDAGPGNLIGRVRGNWSIAGATSAADGNWALGLLVSNTDTLSVNDVAGSGDLFTGSQGASGSFEVVATAARRFAALQWYYAIAGGSAGSNAHYGMLCSALRVIGNHNLTIRGTTPATEGLYASDIVGHAVRTWAPLLVIKDDSIQQSNFIIPQMAFKDNTTASEIVRQSTRFNLADWGVFAGREFRWYERNTRGRRWRARIAPAQFEETGQQMDRLWESVIVQYNDVDGTARTVGPPGSFADTESASLKDIDPENPANKLGIIRRDKLVMGTSTAAAATEVGRRFLEEQKLLDRSGRARITGHVTDDHGVMHPYWRVLGGDLISFIDASDTSYRRIVKADHDATARTASLDLDAPPEGLDALLERLGVVLAPLGLS
jgi:hypothetical protein